MRHAETILTEITGHECPGGWSRLPGMAKFTCRCWHLYEVTDQAARAHERRYLLREPAPDGHRYDSHEEHLRAHQEYARVKSYGPITPGPRTARLIALDAGCYTLPDGECVGRGCMHDPSGVHPVSRGPAPTLSTIDRVLRESYAPAIRANLAQGSSLLDYMKRSMTVTDRAEGLRQQAADLLTRANLLESRIADPFEDDDVISWERTYGEYAREPGKVYTFVAVKADGRWYLTGQETGALSWDRLVEEHLEHASDGPWVVTGWKGFAVHKQRRARR